MGSSYYLLEYPPDERPVLWLNASSYEIVAASESEIRFKEGENKVEKSLTRVVGAVVFKDETSDTVKGFVISSKDGILVMNTTVGEGLTFKRMIKEQLKVLTKYGKAREEEHARKNIKVPKGWRPSRRRWE